MDVAEKCRKETNARGHNEPPVDEARMKRDWRITTSPKFRWNMVISFQEELSFSSLKTRENQVVQLSREQLVLSKYSGGYYSETQSISVQ